MRGMVLALALIGAFSAFAYNQSEYSEGSEPFEASDIQRARDKYLSGAVDLDFEWLKSLIRQSGARSIEELLPHLPENLRASYTLMKASASLQESSPMQPRAIVFAHDGSLVLTFNGSERQSGFQSLEVLEFSQQNKEFRLFEVDFSQAGDKRFSDPNPAKCMSCHASWPKPHGAAKPIWSHYSHWLGAYGERDDKFIDILSRRGGEYDGQPEDPEHDYREWNEYQKFLKTSEAHPRYRHLIRREQFSQAAPYVLHTSAEFSDKSGRWNQRKIINMPNLRLAKVLDVNNARRVAATMIRHPDFETLSWRVLYQNLCSGFQLKAQWEMAELDDFGLSLNDLNLAFNESQTIYHNGNPSQKSTHIIIHEIFRHLMASDPILKDHYQASSPFAYYVDFGFPPVEKTRMKGLGFQQRPESWQFSYVWAEVFASLGQVLKLPSAAGFCGYVSEKLQPLDSMAEVSPAPFFRPPVEVQVELSRTKSPQQILTSCADCHDSGLGYAPLSTAPYYPFSNDSALAGFLKRLQRYGQLQGFLALVDRETQPDMSVVYSDESATLSEAYRYQQVMPLGRERLTATERKNLLEYISSLAGAEE